LAEAISGETPIDIEVYPKAHVLNRVIAKLIDLLIVAAADRLVPPVGFLAGLVYIRLVYIMVADGFAGGRSVGKRLIGLQTILPRTREAAGFKESIVRNLPFGLAQLMFEVPYIGWLGSLALLSFEGLLMIGNDHGRRLGDEVARTQVLDAGQLDLPD
jgi:hypothetical protein